MSDLRNHNGLADENAIIALARSLDTCPDIHDRKQRLAAYLEWICKHDAEAHRRATIRKHLEQASEAHS